METSLLPGSESEYASLVVTRSSVPLTTCDPSCPERETSREVVGDLKLIPRRSVRRDELGKLNGTLRRVERSYVGSLGNHGACRAMRESSWWAAMGRAK